MFQSLNTGIVAYLVLTLAGLVVISVGLLVYPEWAFRGETLGLAYKVGSFVAILIMALAERIWRAGHRSPQDEN